MATIPVKTFWVSQALNEMPKSKKVSTKYSELKYMVKWALVENIMNIHLDSNDMMFLGDYLGEEGR